MDNMDKISWALFIGIAVASILLQTCRYKKAIEIFTECSVLLKQFKGEKLIINNNGNIKELGVIFMQIGRLHGELEEYSQAKDFYEKAIATFKKAGDHALIKLGEALNDLGKYYEILRDFQNAKRVQYEALEISECTGKKSEKIMIYGNLGDIHTCLKEFENAEKCYMRALSISKELGEKSGEAFTYKGLRGFYHSKNDYAMAETCARKALELYAEIGDKREEGTLNSELGKLCHFLGRYEEALEFHRRTFAIYKKIGDRCQGKKLCIFALGQIYIYLSV